MLTKEHFEALCRRHLRIYGSGLTVNRPFRLSRIMTPDGYIYIKAGAHGLNVSTPDYRPRMAANGTSFISVFHCNEHGKVDLWRPEVAASIVPYLEKALVLDLLAENDD